MTEENYNRRSVITRRGVALVITVSLAAAILVAGCGRKLPLIDNDLSQRLDEYVQALNQACENQQVSGSIYITQKGEIVAAKFYGLADYRKQQPFSPQTRFLLCSATKVFTAIGIMQMQEKGLLRLDDCLSQYYPDQLWTEKITIRQLLTHTAGVLRDVTDRGLISPYEYTDRSLLQSQILQSPLLFRPGTDMAYSNAGYQLLAGIIEKVSGLTYGKYLKKYIFGPAKMAGTGCIDMGAEAENLAPGHEYSSGSFYKQVPYDLSHAFGSGNIYTTPNDMALFDKALLNGVLIKADTLAQMAVDNTGLDRGYGLGCYVDKFEGSEWFGHFGNFSSGYFSCYVHFPQESIGIIMLFNTNWSDNTSIMKAASTIALGRSCSLPQKRQRLAPDQVAPALYEGVYEAPGGQAITIKSVDGLLMAFSDRAAPMTAFAKNRFYDSLHELWEYTFETDNNGKVAGCVVSNGFDTIRLKKKEGDYSGKQ